VAGFEQRHRVTRSGGSGGFVLLPGSLSADDDRQQLGQQRLGAHLELSGDRSPPADDVRAAATGRRSERPELDELLLHDAV
jgi:hypothetical protein